MKRSTLVGFSGFLAVVVVAAAVVVASPQPTDVGAQAQPTIPSSIIQLPPPVPGLDYTPQGSGHASLTVPVVTGGTPVADQSSPDALAPATGNSVTASLGGSDISVSSVGGSYEVDGPKKRRNRSPRR